MNSIKTFFHGKPLKEVYPHATRWQCFKFAIRKLARKIVILSVIIGSLTLSSLITKAIVVQNPIIYQAKAEATPVDTASDSLQLKIEELKHDIVQQIKSCESQGYNADSGLITYDPLQSNPSKTKKRDIPSIGLFQLKQSTVQHYYKTLYQKDITATEAITIALSDTQSTQLAYDIIFLTKNNDGMKNWLNCANKHNIRGQVEIINKLSQ